jgi:phage terminase large subunit GpA-like protein
MTSLQSPAGMRSESNQVLLVDEVDAAPKETTTGEGNYLGILDGRTAAYGSNWKVINTSTPATFEGSVIHPEFEAGDQRYYYVPCLLCGTYFVYDFKYFVPINDKHGYLERVFHECPNCNREIWNSNKFEMMRIDHAEWRPTAIPQDRAHRSYQISGLYSPFASWERVYKANLKAQEDPTLKPSFVNLWEGRPFKEEGHRPDHKKISKYTGEYKMKSVPDEVIFLTMSADVQRGKEKYQAMSPDELDRVTAKLIESKGADNVWKTERLPRIEFEIMGVGLNLKTWLIDYGVVYGHTTLGPHEGAFRKLREMIESGKFSYLKKDGQKMAPVMVFIDASDGMTRQSVFDFCHGWPKVFPIVNHAEMKLKKDKMIDEASPFDIDRYRFKNKAKDGGAHYLLSVNHYKARLYRNLNTPRNHSGNQAPTFCDFPRDTPEHYFKMLTAEEMREDGSFHRSESVPAEALDNRAYNLAVEDIFLDLKVEEAKKAARLMRYKKGPRKGERMYSDSEVDDIDSKWVLNQMKAPA